MYCIKFELNRVRIRLDEAWIWVGLGSGIFRFGLFRVRVYIGLIGVRVDSDSVRVISGSGLHRVNRSLGRFRFGSGHIGFRVKSGHYSFGSVWFWVGLISNFGSKSVQLFLMSVWVWFRVIRFGSIRFRVSSGSIRAMSDFGTLQFQINLVLSRFNFEFRVEIGSTLSHVGLGLVSGCSVRVVGFRSLLPGLILWLVMLLYNFYNCNLDNFF